LLLNNIKKDLKSSASEKYRFKKIVNNFVRNVFKHTTNVEAYLENIKIFLNHKLQNN